MVPYGMKVLALIADIVHSRDITERKTFQRKLQRQLTRINQVSRDMIVSPYTITLGDEFQAVYKGFSGVFRDVVDVLSSMYPCRIRFAFGYDQLTTAVNPDQAIGMDGPAFHLARDGLQSLKAERRTIVRFIGSELPALDLVNQSILLFCNDLEQWKENTLRILCRLQNGSDIKTIAGELGISARGVYKNINLNHLRDYLGLFRIIETRLSAGV